MKRLLLLCIVFFALFASLATSAQIPIRKGWWKFDDPADMVKAEIGSPLVLTGTQTSIPGPVAGNLATQVPLGSYLTMTHGIAANGGGAMVNEYTLQIDFSVSELAKWYAFFQTTVANTDDAELFINTSNQIGVGATGYSANAVSVDTWYRMIVSVKNGSFFRVYLNGELWLDGTPQDVDGRMALDNALLLFGDNDGDDGTINCSEAAIWDVALNADQIAELGDAAKTQIPTRKGWWKFDDAADMLKADIGSPLVLTGTQTSVPGPVDGNLATQIGIGSYLKMTHGIAPNGGGDSVNVYSVQIDFSVPEIGKWHSFIQTEPTNGGGGSKGDADLFTNTSDHIGTSATGYSTNAIAVNTWYRMVISVKNGEFFRVYLNGELWLEKTGLAVDGRWALTDVLLLFADDDGDDATINCSEAAIWDVALTADQALELGSATTTPRPTRKGWWKFDDASNMLKAEVESPLVLTGTQTSVQGPAVGNLATQIGIGSYLTMTHGIAPNGGGDSVNVYSVQIDFSVPEVGKWHSFIQTEPTNAGGSWKGDADLFTNTSNHLGTSATGYSTNAITANTWYRMVISVKNGEFFRVYLNGDLWLEKTGLAVDGRWALTDVLLIFADDDGDDATINCSELAIWDTALTADQALKLGKASNSVLVNSVTVTSAGNATTIDTQGGTLQMSATVLPVDATDPTITWSVVNGTGSATISATGLLTAVKNGIVTVKATSNDGGNVVGSMDITITNQPVVLVTSIAVTSSTGIYTIDLAGGTLQMVATVLPDNATDKSVTWSVTNGTGEGTITADGLLTATKDGYLAVKATANDGSAKFGSKLVTNSNQTSIRGRKGCWKFDDANDMLKATIGQPLTLSGTQTSVAGPAAGNLATEVPLGSYLIMTHGIAANGGGALVNEWSLQIDFSVAQIDTWYAFFQTLDGDADLFIAKTAAGDIGRVPNSIGCGSTLYSTNTVMANTWYRMIVSVKNGVFFRIYVNGALWLDSPNIQPVDGRYGLASTLQIFEDNDGDDGTINCSELGIWDVALTSGEAAALGDPTTAITGIFDNHTNENNVSLSQNYPNPFSYSTTFPYQVKNSGDVTFRILDILGKEVEVINEGTKTPGSYTLEVKSNSLRDGIYFIQMTTNNQTSTRRMVIMR